MLALMNKQSHHLKINDIPKANKLNITTNTTTHKWPKFEASDYQDGLFTDRVLNAKTQFK